MLWRYQPVWTEQDGERTYSVCEVYFDEADKLTGWTDDCCNAQGATPEEFGAGLVRMYVDAACWQPVNHADLRPGFVFERRITMAQRETMAAMFDQWKLPQ